jgi:murein L,D-transpeptidase YcbB/YkuD
MADFKTAFEYTMNFEDRARSGVVTEEPNGAKARLGINSKYNPDMPAEFWTCPVAQALEIAAIREEARYWKPLKLDQVKDQAVANKLFDEGINASIREAGLLVQRALGIKQDGVIGPQTISAINSAEPIQLLTKLRAESKAYYEAICAQHPNLSKWLHSYLVRAAA